MMQRDAAFRSLFGNAFPGAQLLRRFRRENRPVVHDCLSKVLRLAAVAPLTEGAREPWDAEQCHEEAAHRLDLAAGMDSLEIDC